jgi:hypothetical protein
VSAFFLVGLLFRFANPACGMLRGLTLLMLLLLLPIRALARGSAPDDQGTDYLAVCGPLVLVLGSAFFRSLLDHVDWRIEGARTLALVGMVTVLVLPLVLLLLPPRQAPSPYPPYHPPLIRQLAQWVEPVEWVMSDMPWAVAWYADRTAAGLTRFATEPEHREDFETLHARHAIVGLYLTLRTMDQEFYSKTQRPRMAREVAQARARQEGEAWQEERILNAIGWEEFSARAILGGRMPAGFPLRSAHAVYAVSGQLLLMDRARWQKQEGASRSGASETRTPSR